jgi:hypothetical protein
VPALDGVAAKFPAQLGPEARVAVLALIKALGHEDALVGEAAAALLK